MFLKTDRDRQRLTETDLSKRRWLFAVRWSFAVVAILTGFALFAVSAVCTPFAVHTLAVGSLPLAVCLLEFAVCHLSAVCLSSVACYRHSAVCRLSLPVVGFCRFADFTLFCRF